MSEAPSFAEFTAHARARPPAIGVVLGSGLHGLVGRCSCSSRLPFAAVPGLCPTTVEGHRGFMTLGEWAGKHVLIFEGRLHYYEGHVWEIVVEPVRIAQFLNVSRMVFTNAAGGIHSELQPGRLMAVTDHIEWTRRYCWRHAGPGGLGSTRTPPYSARLLELIRQSASASNLGLHAGTYAAVTGPCYETPAEIRAMKAWGADAVGMSTAREAQQGHELGMECAAVSLITNRAAGLSARPINHQEVLSAAAASAERLGDLLEALLARL